MDERARSPRYAESTAPGRDSWFRRNHVGWSSAWLLIPPGIAFVAGCVLALPPTGQAVVEAAQSVDDAVARFTDAGELVRPDGHRERIDIGTPLTPDDLNPPEAPLPEFPVSTSSHRPAEVPALHGDRTGPEPVVTSYKDRVFERGMRCH